MKSHQMIAAILRIITESDPHIDSPPPSMKTTHENYMEPSSVRERRGKYFYSHFFTRLVIFFSLLMKKLEHNIRRVKKKKISLVGWTHIGNEFFMKYVYDHRARMNENEEKNCIISAKSYGARLRRRRCEVEKREEIEGEFINFIKLLLFLIRAVYFWWDIVFESQGMVTKYLEIFF